MGALAVHETSPGVEWGFCGAAAPRSPIAAQAIAQDEDDAPRRTRVILGPQLVPRFPGADGVAVRPYIDVSRTRGDRPFDCMRRPTRARASRCTTSAGCRSAHRSSFEGKRRGAMSAGSPIGFTVELGAALQYQGRGPLRLFAEARKGLGGHRGVVGSVGIDYVARDADRWLWAIGPRLTVGNGRYARAYFGVSAREALATGVAAYRPDIYVAAGATASTLYQLSDRWGVFGYAKYDRLLSDASNSPVTRLFGSRDQLSGGAGVSYTFGRR